jgi:hypothetical protein
LFHIEQTQEKKTGALDLGHTSQRVLMRLRKKPKEESLI